ncbi:uncharacterized protein AC631_04202 [Debaryomyces fabryi]|uniref:Uncharacterized protein n=1 Tax=Debaryomyces fabryi TaxID=58627 RepID=A0A0V1PV36_9ASCO|nr:uncharacterized protein AC631_04202 [Debaryomyces fabryi]KSA00048.1 hypothetical protein AC631_04202 [Debaryomyces fabryi]CUM45830.1 unnamed protein product [Debaryomyces fabryi]
MTKPSNCSVTVATGKLDEDNAVRKRIENIFKSNPILQGVSVILKSKSLPLNIDKLLENIRKIDLNEFEKLPELLQEVSGYKSKGFITIEGIPLHQVWDDSSLDITDSIQFNSVTNQIKIKLNKSTFESSPNVFDNRKGILIKKIMESKKGHGALNHVSYSYLITMSTLEEGISHEVHHLIKSVFKYSSVKVRTNCANNISCLRDVNKIIGNSTIIPLKLNIRDYPIFNVDFQEANQAIYEYLTLLHINSPQLTENIDDYISSYKIPEYLAQNTEHLQELYKYTFDEIDFSVLDSLMRSNCLSISAYATDSHIMILNTQNTLVLWECQ